MVSIRSSRASSKNRLERQEGRNLKMQYRQITLHLTEQQKWVSSYFCHKRWKSYSFYYIFYFVLFYFIFYFLQWQVYGHAVATFDLFDWNLSKSDLASVAELLIYRGVNSPKCHTMGLKLKPCCKMSFLTILPYQAK